MQFLFSQTENFTVSKQGSITLLAVFLRLDVLLVASSILGSDGGKAELPVLEPCTGGQGRCEVVATVSTVRKPFLTEGSVSFMLFQRNRIVIKL